MAQRIREGSAEGCGHALFFSLHPRALTSKQRLIKKKSTRTCLSVVLFYLWLRVPFRIEAVIKILTPRLFAARGWGWAAGRLNLLVFDHLFVASPCFSTRRCLLVAVLQRHGLWIHTLVPGSSNRIGCIFVCAKCHALSPNRQCMCAQTDWGRTMADARKFRLVELRLDALRA